MNKILSFLGIGAISTVTSLAQTPQFEEVPGAVPGPVVWSEGVETFDANGDGKLDLLYTNGNGFSSAGGALAPTLLINQTTTGGTINFADETSTRIPAGYVQQGKGLTACDVDGDGDIDIVFANAFQNQPTILINDGSGVFTDETAARFPVLTLNSFGVGFGDVDNDGALDLVFCDSGTSAFGGTGGKARLFINDGSGHFTDSPGRLNAANKVGSQNAHLVDIDDDFDLDVIIDGKSSGQQLYLNDGTGNFAIQPTGTLPNGSANTYATQWGDLDNDNDLDGFYLSLSGFNEGTAQNALVPSGSLAFSGTSATLTGINGQDDNDIAFLDANDDGLLDVIVGSLANSKEKLYLNSGTFGTASFVYQANGFTALTDSTLDLTVGDFDDDGRYDIATAQGESGSFQNRVYRNGGPADTTPPHIGRVEPAPARVPLSVIQQGGLVRRAWIQDSTYHRGQAFVQAALSYDAVKGASTQHVSTPMTIIGGQIQRATIQPAPSPTGTVGMDVTYVVHASDPNANASDSSPLTFRICGAESYGTAGSNSTGAAAHISASEEPSLNANQFSISADHIPPGAPCVVFFGTAKLDQGVPFGNGLRFVDGTLVRLAALNANAGGVATLALDFNAFQFAGIQAGDTRYFQIHYLDPAAGGALFNGSDGLEVTFCD